MENIKKNINKIVIGLVLVFIGTFIFNYINKEESVDVVEVVVGSGNQEDAEIARQIIEALNELEKINIQYNFFTQDVSQSSNLIAFSDLFDFSEKDLRGKEIGKNNPFLANSSPFDFRTDTIVSQPEQVVIEEIISEPVVEVEEVFESDSQTI